ncbi:hypothetical protein Ndes2526B_g08238 [Nannochloris sp. 'desiccata']|nr:hypothetical protein KSW81_001712 [Chlorella desiccata (nom. nud.)]KAH7616141.1 putative tRNA/tmRNA (uracil-C(5))-methyltransferase [Chlorella desiccata (nom. nud.)]
MASDTPKVEFTPSLIDVDTDAYDAQLAAKRRLVEEQFAEFNPPKLEVFQSKPKNYRMRSEFTVWHEKEETYYQMYEKDNETGESKRVRVDSFPVASELINELMPRVMEAVQGNIVLRKKLFQANFHTTLAGNSMVTLIYHRKLEDDWKEAAKVLREELSKLPGIANPPHIIGRSRKQKIFLDINEVEEVLDVPGRGTLRYIQVEGAFSQPNAGICTCMLGWAVDVTQGGTSKNHDLLELYCGNGNFTAALAPNFRRVVATEISKSSVAAAKRNFEANKVENVFVARMSSEEFTQAWQTGKKFNRLEGINLKEYDFKTLLVDPPRAGLDDETIKVVRDFERVVYISCNPATLKRDVESVSDLFTVERFAMFDQFPYTHHVECGVYLVRRADAPPVVPPAPLEEEQEEDAQVEPESKKQKIDDEPQP